MNQRNTNKRTNKNKKQLTRKKYGGDENDVDEATAAIRKGNVSVPILSENYENKNQSNSTSSVKKNYSNISEQLIQENNLSSDSPEKIIEGNNPAVIIPHKLFPPNTKCILLVDEWLNQKNIGTKIAKKGEPTNEEYETFLLKKKDDISREEANECFAHSGVTIPIMSEPITTTSPTSATTSSETSPLSTSTPTSSETSPLSPTSAVPPAGPQLPPGPPPGPQLPPGPPPQDVEDILKDLYITMDVKVIGGVTPSVIVTMTDNNPWSNVINTDRTIYQPLDIPLVIKYEKSERLNQIVKNLKHSSEEIKIITYLNKKKKLFDITEALKLSDVNYDDLISILRELNLGDTFIIRDPTEERKRDVIIYYIYDITIKLIENYNQPSEPLQSYVFDNSSIIPPYASSGLPSDGKVTGGGTGSNHELNSPKNLKQTVQKVKNLVNTKIGGKNLVMGQLENSNPHRYAVLP